MVSSFAEILATAVLLRRDRPQVYARLVHGALRAQMGRDWLIQLGGILALVDEELTRAGRYESQGHHQDDRAMRVEMALGRCR